MKKSYILLFLMAMLATGEALAIEKSYGFTVKKTFLKINEEIKVTFELPDSMKIEESLLNDYGQGETKIKCEMNAWDNDLDVCMVRVCGKDISKSKILENGDKLLFKGFDNAKILEEDTEPWYKWAVDYTKRKLLLESGDTVYTYYIMGNGENMYVLGLFPKTVVGHQKAQAVMDSANNHSWFYNSIFYWSIFISALFLGCLIYSEENNSNGHGSAFKRIFVCMLFAIPIITITCWGCWNEWRSACYFALGLTTVCNLFYKPIKWIADNAEDV